MNHYLIQYLESYTGKCLVNNISDSTLSYRDERLILTLDLILKSSIFLTKLLSIYESLFDTVFGKLHRQIFGQ